MRGVSTVVVLAFGLRDHMSRSMRLRMRVHRCVKYDPLTPASVVLKELPQSVLDGVLTLYEAYALTIPPTRLHTCFIGEGGTESLREAISQCVCAQPTTCGVSPWCQMLDPALVGLCHSLDPNTMLTDDGQLIAVRRIAAGERLTCDFGGYRRLDFSQLSSLESDPYPASSDGVSKPTAAVLDGLAIAIDAAARVCLHCNRCHGETRQACCQALPSEWVATRLQKLMVALQQSGCGRQSHWGVHAARAMLLRMSFASRNSVGDY